MSLALADLAVSSAQAKVRKYLDQEITFHQNDLVYLDGNGKAKIRLPERPVRSVSKVEEGSGDPVWTVLGTDYYFLRDSVLIRWDGSPWTAGVANVRVTYNHGWNIGAIDSDTSDSDYEPTLNVPPDISLVTLSLARRIYEAMGLLASGQSGNVQSETIGAYSYTLQGAAESAGAVNLATAEKAVLDSYKMKGSG